MEMNGNATNENKCPACGSARVEFEGLVHGSTIGCEPAVSQKKFKCAGCKETFWVEANPKDRTRKS